LDKLRADTHDSGARLSEETSNVIPLFATRVAQAATLNPDEIKDIALLLDDDTLKVMGLKWQDKSKGVLEVTFRDGSAPQEPIFIQVSDLKEAQKNAPEGKVSIQDVMAIVNGKDQAIVNALDGLLTELKDKFAVLEINPQAFGNIHKDPTKLQQFLLEYAKKVNSAELARSGIRFIGSDEVAIQKAKRILNDLIQSYSLDDRFKGRILGETPQGASVIEITSPKAAINRQEGKHYAFLDTSQDGAYTFSIEYLVTAARIEVSKDKPLDERFVRATEELTGQTITNQKDLKDVLQGLADLATRLKYALKAIVPLELNAAVQFTKNMIRSLGQAA
jgi:hypothetical protein